MGDKYNNAQTMAYRHNLVYMLNMLKNKKFKRKEIIRELEYELGRFDAIVSRNKQEKEDGNP